MILKSNGILLYELNAFGVEDVKYHNDNNGESLEIIVSSRDSVWLRIKPRISIAHNTTRARENKPRPITLFSYDEK